jgi:hypothetical protein
MPLLLDLRFLQKFTDVVEENAASIFRVLFLLLLHGACLLVSLSDPDDVRNETLAPYRTAWHGITF